MRLNKIAENEWCRNGDTGAAERELMTSLGLSFSESIPAHNCAGYVPSGGGRDDLLLFTKTSVDEVPVSEYDNSQQPNLPSHSSKCRSLFDSPIPTSQSPHQRHSIASASTATTPALYVSKNCDSFKAYEEPYDYSFAKETDATVATVELCEVPSNVELNSINVEFADAISRTRKRTPFFHKFAMIPRRMAEIQVRSVCCAQTEAAAKKLLYSIDGVFDVYIDPVATLVFVEYDPRKTGASSLVTALRKAFMAPTGVSLRSVGREEGEAQLSSFSIQLPPEHRSKNGRIMLQNHTSAQHGVKNCVFSSSGEEMSVMYDSAIIGARQILTYINRAGVDCQATDDRHQSLEQSVDEENVGGQTFLLLLTILLLWMEFSVPFELTTPLLNGISKVVIIHLSLSAAAINFIATPIVMSGASGLKLKFFSGHLVVGVSAILIFSLSVVGLFVTWFSAEFVKGSNDPVEGLGCILMFDQVAWLLICWSLGQRVTRRLKRRLARPLAKIEKCLRPLGSVRILDVEGQVNLVSRPLVQKGDTVVVKSGETVWCDGIATTKAVIKESPLISGTVDSRPYTIAEGKSVFAGSLVMSGELRLTAVKVGETNLERAIVATRRHALKDAWLHEMVQKWAYPVSIITTIGGIVIGLYNLIFLEQLDGSGAALIEALLRATCFASAIWLGTMSCAANSASAVMPSASSLLLASHGILPTSARALLKCSKAKNIVVSRSALIASNACEVAFVMLCPSVCKFAATELGIPEKKIESTPPWKILSVDQGIVQISDEGNSRALNLVWTIISHLEAQSTLKDSWLGRLLLKESSAYASSSRQPSTSTRLFPGKGIEGTAPSFTRMTSTAGSLEPQPGVVAVGSLEFILACHQFSIDKNRDLSPKKNWRAMLEWSEKQLNNGDDVVLVAYDGTPLAALSIKVKYPCFLGSAINYLEHSGRQVWLCTSSNRSISPSLSAKTCIPFERMVFGASPSDTAQLVERISDRTGKATSLVSANIGLLDELSKRKNTMWEESVSILMGGHDNDISSSIDITIPGHSIAALINLYIVADVATKLHLFVSFLGFFCLPIGTAVALKQLPLSAWRFAPITALLASIFSEWIVLLFALSLHVVKVAAVARAITTNDQSLDQLPYEKALDPVSRFGARSAQNTGHLELPKGNTFLRMTAAAFRSVSVGTLQGVERLKAIITRTKDYEQINKMLWRLEETERINCAALVA